VHTPLFWPVMAVHAARLPPAFKNSCIDGRLDIIMSREEHDLLQTIARSSPAAIMPAPTVPATTAARRDALGAGAGADAGVGEVVGAGDVVGAGAGVFAEVLGTAANTNGERALDLLPLVAWPTGASHWSDRLHGQQLVRTVDLGFLRTQATRTCG